MAPYLINHPCVVDQWMTSRERAFAQVLEMPCEPYQEVPLKTLLAKAQLHLEQVRTINARQDQLNNHAIEDLRTLWSHLSNLMAEQEHWAGVFKQCTVMSLEAQEILTSCLIELYPSLVDVFETQMNSDESLSISGGKSVKDVLQILESKYRWSIDADYSLAENNYWFLSLIHI